MLLVENVIMEIPVEVTESAVETIILGLYPW